jgi:hypothetical protein
MIDLVSRFVEDTLSFSLPGSETHNPAASSLTVRITTAIMGRCSTEPGPTTVSLSTVTPSSLDP